MYYLSIYFLDFILGGYEPLSTPAKAATATATSTSPDSTETELVRALDLASPMGKQASPIGHDLSPNPLVRSSLISPELEDILKPPPEEKKVEKLRRKRGPLKARIVTC